MLSVVPKLLIELRDDAAVSAIVSDRVRAPEPAGAYTLPDGTQVAGDARGPDDWVAFVVIETLGTPREPRVPVQRPRFAIRCYGRTPTEAMNLYNACSDAIHHLGPRVHANGLGIYISHDDTGGATETDPNTHQPLVSFVAELIATTQAVAV